MTSVLYLSTVAKALLIAILLMRFAVLSSASDEGKACAGDPLVFGFYAFFNPVSYSADSDPASKGFDTHLGYEADLLTALETMRGSGLSFSRQAIPVWDDIWLQSATQYDIVGGGITILDSRTRDADGEERVIFTSGHIAFRQSLLVRVEDGKALDSYDKLTSDLRVGALAGTTGEARLLQLTGLVNEHGALIAGARIDTAKGTLIADGSENYVITAAGESPSLAGRQHLHPPSRIMPQVIYLGAETGESELLEALANGEIDAIARGEIGNRGDASRASDQAFIVSVLDEEIEYGGFALNKDAVELVACLDEKINWLTDDLRIGYAEWLDDPAIFLKRAKVWNEKQEQEEPNEMNSDEQ